MSQTIQYIKRGFGITLLGGLLAGCTDLEDLNKDSYNPVYLPGEQNPDEDDKPNESKYADLDINYTVSDSELENLVNGQTKVSALFGNMTYEGCYNDYQITTNLTHDIYSAYVANNKPNFNFNSPTYSYTDGWSATRWNHFYSDRTSNEYAQLLRTFRFVDYAKYKNAFYITRIYWAFLASMQTDTYGDVPLSAYVQAKPVEGNVPYDTQEKAYDVIFRLLEQATDSIVPGACEFKFSQTDDKCYGGDEEKWLRFANTLRLRLALRISNVDPERARKEGELAMANKWGLLKDDSDNMRTVPRHAPVELGGINAGGDENALAMCSFAYNGDCVMSKDMELAYKELSTGGTQYTVLSMTDGPQQKVIDPRGYVCWWRPTDLDMLKQGREFPFTDYTGCEIGDYEVKHTETVKKFSVTRTDVLNSRVLDPTRWFSYSRESVWLSFSELQFLLAEASLRGWSGVNKTPHEYFQDGIRASMNYYQVSVADSEDYIRGLKIYNGGANPFEGNNKEEMLEQIITQKWLAVFPNGNEGWAEFRRTDYPALRNILNNNSGGDVPEGKFIKRILYPYGEKDNTNKPVAKDKQGIRVWWDVADTNDDNGSRLQPNNFRNNPLAKFF
ncbi:MAG: SusD/RagB family nutrient-binding outer membrane lipoprotein [Bacteroidales bacterium]